MDRETKQLYKQLEKALEKFREALEFEDTEPMRESLLQRFEYTFELSWKLMGCILKEQSIQVYGVKNTIREAGSLGLIENVEKWLEYANARNKTAHIYKEETAKEVAETARAGFEETVASLLENASDYDV